MDSWASWHRALSHYPSAAAQTASSWAASPPLRPPFHVPSQKAAQLLDCGQARAYFPSQRYQHCLAQRILECPLIFQSFSLKELGFSAETRMCGGSCADDRRRKHRRQFRLQKERKERTCLYELPAFQVWDLKHVTEIENKSCVAMGYRPVGWCLFLKWHPIIFYHLFSCSFCHSVHKNVFVFKFRSILDMEGVFWLYAKKCTKIALDIFQQIEIAITRSKIVQMSSSFAHTASFSVRLW